MALTLLAQAQAVPALGDLMPIVGFIVFVYLAYKATMDIYMKGKEAEASEFRRTLTGLPALVAIFALIAITTMTVSLEAVFGIGATIMSYVLALATPVLFGVMFASFLAFVVRLAKMEMKFPGI